MHILVIGTGYVGLVTATCFAEMGHHVTCLDIDEAKIQKLQEGVIPFYEPELAELVNRSKKAKRLFFMTDYAAGLKNTEVCFVAVGTPPKSDGAADLSYLKEAFTSIGEHLARPTLIVIKSTVPVGTARQMEMHLKQVLTRHSKELPFEIASNPEFLKEGSALQDCMKPDRVVIGTSSLKATETLRALYSSFTLNHDRILVMDPASAEMTKYASNAMLATRISFMNELAGLCEKTGVHIDHVRKGMSADKRIGYHFLYAGAGYGGSCFPKDICALIAAAKQKGHQTPILEAVHAVNEAQKQVLVDKILSYFEEGANKKVIAIWGLAFKPNTDDVREAPALSLITALLQEGAKLRLYDPLAMENAKKVLPVHAALTFCSSEYEAAKGADAIALVTEWKQFRFAHLEEILASMRGCAFFDGRNQYQGEEMKQKGFDYFGIGIPAPDERLKELQKLSQHQGEPDGRSPLTSHTH